MTTEEERKARRREYQRQWRQSNPEYNRLWKQANAEKVNHQARQRYAADLEQSRALMRDRNRRWREANPERARALMRDRNRRWREANPERARELQRERNRRWREANPERARELQRERDRRWQQSNPERVRELGRESMRRQRKTNPEHMRERARQWREANPQRAREIGRQNGHMRRARKASATDPCQPVTMASIARRVLLFGNSCAYCGVSDPLHIDHVEPLVLGGLHVPGNLAPACERCNCSKGGTPVEAWYLSQPFFSPDRWEALQAHTGNRWEVAEQPSLAISLPTPGPKATPAPPVAPVSRADPVAALPADPAPISRVAEQAVQLALL